MEKQLRKRIPDEQFRNHLNTIKAIATGPYLTALPTVMDVRSVYAPQHAAAFRIDGGRTEVRSLGEGITELIPVSIGLAEFAQGICLLPPDQIYNLRHSNEASYFFQASSQFNASEYERSVRDFRTALAAYVQRINEVIVQKFRVSMGSDDALRLAFDVKSHTSRSRAVSNAFDWISNAFAYISIIAPQLASSTLLNLVLIQPVKEMVSLVHSGETAKGVNDRDAGMSDQLIGDLSRRWRKDEIATEVGYPPRRNQSVSGEVLHASRRVR
ncbi:MAG TPA: hypothetical protein VGT78_00140 [Rhizomicrobium sp.]|nr:hypothetical protein [Rhizomicrobium sp.]